jgi:hypothetical protein
MPSRSTGSDLVEDRALSDTARERNPARKRSNTTRTAASNPGLTRPPTASLKYSARPPRPSEPILIPKLRIQFADFPYPHSSID